MATPYVAHDMVLDAGDRRPRIGRRREVGAELRLSALALGHHDQPLGDLQRCFRAMPLPDERQAEIDARRDASRSDQAPIADIDQIRFDFCLGEPGRQGLCILPMGRDSPIVQETGIAKDKSPSARAPLPAAAASRPPG
jgi:hypothetical protein